jgi:Leucine-rich repeat (LRR) protein
MRKLWEDHVIWTRMYIVSVAHDLPDATITAARLMRNQEEIGTAFAPYYGESVGSAVTALLKEHISGAANILKAAKGEKTKAKVGSLVEAWRKNATDIAKALHGLNPNFWDFDVLERAMQDHLDQTLEEAVFRLKGRYEDDVEAYGRVTEHVLAMADMLSDGIFARFCKSGRGTVEDDARTKIAKLCLFCYERISGKNATLGKLSEKEKSTLRDAGSADASKWYVGLLIAYFDHLIEDEPKVGSFGVEGKNGDEGNAGRKDPLQKAVDSLTTMARSSGSSERRRELLEFVKKAVDARTYLVDVLDRIPEDVWHSIFAYLPSAFNLASAIRDVAPTYDLNSLFSAMLVSKAWTAAMVGIFDRHVGYRKILFQHAPLLLLHDRFSPILDVSPGRNLSEHVAFALTETTVGKLTNLTRLNLSKAPLFSMDLTFGKDLTNLTDLSCGINASMLRNDLLTRLTNLTRLKATMVKRSESDVERYLDDSGLSKMTNLTQLGLNNTAQQITHPRSKTLITDEGLRYLINLKKLSLRHNRTIAGGSYLSRMTGLTEITLRNDTKGFDFSEANALKNLSVTSMRGGGVANVHAIYYKAFSEDAPYLEDLRISQSEDTEIISSLFLCTSLRILSVSYNLQMTSARFFGANFESSPLTTLRHLKIRSCPSFEESRDLSLVLYNLETLDLVHTKHFRGDCFSSLTNLRSLNLHHVPIKNENLALLTTLAELWISLPESLDAHEIKYGVEFETPDEYAFQNLTSLSRMELSGDFSRRPFRGEGLKTLTRLVHLDLGMENLYVVKDHLTHLALLEELYFPYHRGRVNVRDSILPRLNKF